MTACFGNDGLEHVKTQLEERLNIAKLHEYSVLHWQNGFSQIVSNRFARSAKLYTAYCVTSDKKKALEGESLGQLLNKTMMKHKAHCTVLRETNWPMIDPWYLGLEQSPCR